MNRYEERLTAHPVMKEMHIPQKGDTIRSFHRLAMQKTSWYFSGWKTMKARDVPTNPNQVSYPSKIYPYHGLHRSYLVTRTPEIHAKEGYRIRFCRDLFINMIKEFSLDFDESVQLQYGNTKSLKMSLKKRKDWSDYESEVGNETEFSVHLPPRKICLYIPWTYSVDKAKYFPLQLCGNQNDLSHNIEFRLNLEDHLLIETTEGEPVDFSWDHIEVEGNVKRIPIPQMMGLYSSLTMDECKHNICTEMEPNAPDPVYFSDSIYYEEDKNEIELGKKTILKFDSKRNQPVTRIDWGAVNIEKSETEKDLSFDTHYDDSPIEHSTLENSIETILSKVDSYETEVVTRFPYGEKCYPGMNRWENNILIYEDRRKFTPPVCFDGGNLSMALRAPREEEKGKKYLAFAVLHHVSRFRFVTYPKTQDERLKVRATLIGDEN